MTYSLHITITTNDDTLLDEYIIDTEEDDTNARMIVRSRIEKIVLDAGGTRR